MQILKIGYNNYFNQYNNTKTQKYHTPNREYQNNTEYNIPFMAYVSKEMPRFYYFFKDKMPTTVKSFLDKQPNKFLLKPFEAHKMAYQKLTNAASIEEIQQKLFPNEELFYYLISINETKDNDGLLGIYKDYKDLYPNGILKSGKDLTLYLVNKLFAEAKLISEVNKDLENDLHEDIKAEFKQRCPKSDYVQSKTLKSLGINLPDTGYLNALKFTREGYAIAFGLIISEALQRKLEGMTEEEKQIQLYPKNGVREHWWNSLTREQKLELIAELEEEQENVYKNYKDFEKEHKYEIKQPKSDIPEFYTQQKKKKSSGTKLNDKDLFVIWMKKKLDKVYSELSDEELDAIHIKRSKRQAQRWASMTPEQKIEYINKIRTGMEPLQYAMIDTWNHSIILIKTLSEFLKQQQIFKPAYMVYTDPDYKVLQSRIMTEFWAENKDLAEKFGKRLSYSHSLVEDAVRNGTFDALKEKIELERDERKRILEKEYQAELEEQKQIEAEKIREKEASIPADDFLFRKGFVEIYKNSIDKYNILPSAYTQGMANFILDNFSKDIIIKYVDALKNKKTAPQEIEDFINNKHLQNNSIEALRLQHALETAIALELTVKGANVNLFQANINELIPELEKQYTNMTVQKTQRIDPNRIERLFKQYNREMSSVELNTLANTYFASKKEHLTEEESDLFEKYLNSYGRTLLILFSDKSQYPVEVKDNFNQKFLKLMPNKLKECLHIYIQTHEDIIEENEIGELIAHINKRFIYVPNDVLKIYTREIANAIRIDREKHEDNALEHMKKTFYTKTNEKGQSFPSFEKHLLPLEEKFKIMALEQVMADKLYKVTQNENVYSRNFAQLLNIYDMLTGMKRSQQMTLHNEDGTLMYAIDKKPDMKKLFFKYSQYLIALNSNKDIVDKDGQIDKEELLYTLNPDEGNAERDKYIIQRLESYFTSADKTVEIIKEEKLDKTSKTEELTTIETTVPKFDNSKYKKDFLLEYNRAINRINILPPSYIREMSDIILETYPKEIIEEFLFGTSSKENIINEINKTLPEKCSKENLTKLKRIQHALETAIADELVSKGEEPELYEKNANELILFLDKMSFGNNKSKRFLINKDDLIKSYNHYKRDLTPKELLYIANGYFMSKSETEHPKHEDEIKLLDYLKEYGRSCSILFTGNTVPLKVKAAFNNKFLKLMPQEVKDIARPLIENEEDLKANYDIEVIKQQIAKRFSFIPQDILNTYTREAATVMRMTRLPEMDAEIKENYGMKSFKESLAQRDVDADGGVSTLNFPKYYISTIASKLTLLAAEQAMADELYRVSKNDIVYKYSFEELALWFELACASGLKKGYNKDGLNLSNADNDDGFTIKERPNPDKITQRYVKYMKDFDASGDDLFLPNGELNREEILFCLNPDENLKDRDKYTKERIDSYFVD